MSSQTIDLITIVIALAVAFFLLYQVLNFVRCRPDIVALLSIFALIFGVVGMTTSPAHGLILATVGAIFLFIAAFNFAKSKGAKS